MWPASPKNFAADWDEERVCVRERARDNDEEIAGEVIISATVSFTPASTTKGQAAKAVARSWECSWASHIEHGDDNRNSA